MNFDFDVFLLIERYLPLVLRNPKHLAWLNSLMKPIETLKNDFLVFVKWARREARMNGQVIVMQDYLNDLFDTELRRIRIYDNSGREFIISDVNFFVVPSDESLENKTVPPLYIPSETDFNFDVDFVVKVPFNQSNRDFIISDVNSFIFPIVVNGAVSPMSVVAEIERTVKKYKIAGKTFEIEDISI